MDVYEKITQRIIETLESGVIPWRKEWKTAGKSSGLPYNLLTGVAYKGANVLSLLCSPYASNGWCTYKQALEMGYQVRKGEKASPIIFWSFPDKKKRGGGETSESKSSFAFAKQYSVFNIEQLDGVPEQLPFDDAQPFDAIAEAETIVSAFMASASHPTLAHGGSRAYFRPSTDHVQMPVQSSFISAGGYYATLFHEFIHSTGIKARCNRPELVAMTNFGDEEYSKEELTAEFGSAFLCAEAGIANDERLANSAAYIQCWVRELKNDKTLCVRAAQLAQRAANFVMLRTAATSENSEVAA
jgi:antirestriction protein ArdC